MDDARRPIEDLIRSLEERLLEPAVRFSVDRFAPLLAEDFVEFGASGRVWGKGDVLQHLQQESRESRTVSDFRLRVLSPGVVLATYRAVRHGDVEVRSLRSSIWEQRPTGWELVFHQGTPEHEDDNNRE
jgi:hypothetical protein